MLYASTVHIKTKVSIYQNKNKNATKSQQIKKKSQNLGFGLLCVYVF